MSKIDYYSKYKKYKTKYLLLQYGGLMSPDEAIKKLKDYMNINKINIIFKKEIFEINGIKEFFNDFKLIDISNNDKLKTIIDKHKEAVKEMIQNLISNTSTQNLEILALQMAINVLFISRTDVIAASFKEIIEKGLEKYNIENNSSGIGSRG